MFTGIVEEVGRIQHRVTDGDLTRLTVHGPLVSSDAAHGDSIAVSGVCLTVTAVRGDAFTVDVIGETLRRSSLDGHTAGDPVNLERALPAAGRLGGHVVQGHIDGVGRVLSREPGEHWELVWFQLSDGLSRFVVPKGSIALDGVSLTVVDVERDRISVGLIPTTMSTTTLGAKAAGHLVNVEVDVLAKYVERLLTPHRDPGHLGLGHNGG